VHAPSEEKSDDDTKDSSSEELEQALDHLPKYHTKIPLDLNVKLGREDIFNPKLRITVYIRIVVVMGLE